MLALIYFIPEALRWLTVDDRSDESLGVLGRLRGGQGDDETIVELHKGIVAVAEWEKSIGAGTWGDMVKNDKIKVRGDSLRLVRCRFSNSWEASTQLSVSQSCGSIHHTGLTRRARLFIHSFSE